MALGSVRWHDFRLKDTTAHLSVPAPQSNEPEVAAAEFLAAAQETSDGRWTLQRTLRFLVVTSVAFWIGVWALFSIL